MVASVRIIPGLGGSGPDHWQTRWLQRRPECRRVEQADWHAPDLAAWCNALDAAVRAAPAPVVLVAHSLGCALVGHWLERGDSAVSRVGGALLVAPCDTEAPGACAPPRRFAPMPRQPLPFRSTVVASSNDSFASLDRARGFADDWGSAFVDAGAIGHINAASGLGDWLFGQVLLDTLIASVDADRTPYARAAQLRERRISAF
jgi:predicted alpha/beta hydrolase family esterase